MIRHPCGCPLDEPHDLSHPDCEQAALEAMAAWMPDRQPVRVYEYDDSGLEAACAAPRGVR